MSIPSVKDFDATKPSNCRYWWPQFSPVDEEEIRAALMCCVTAPGDYFKLAYPDWQEQVEFYKQVLLLPFDEACELLYTRRTSCYVRYNFYRDLQGNIVEYKPCCS